MNLFEGIDAQFMTLMFILITIAIFVLILRINSMVKSKTNYYNSLVKLNESTTKENESLTIENKMEATKGMLELTNVLIDSNVLNIIKTYYNLNKRYDLKKLDGDMSIVANQTYHAFTKEIFNNAAYVLDTEYLMQYILDQSLLRLINAVKEYNTTLPMTE